jgi:hypothetical protein
VRMPSKVRATCARIHHHNRSGLVDPLDSYSGPVRQEHTVHC